MKNAGWVMGAMFLLSQSAMAMEPCPRPPGQGEPVLDLQVLEPKVVVRHDVGLRGLTSIAGAMEQAPDGWAIQGLTVANDQMSIAVTWREQKFSANRYCLWPVKASVVLGMPEQRVYVAAEYPETSCEYQAILRHEQRHVQINRQTVLAHEGAIRRALLDGLRQSSPLPLSVHADSQLLARRLQTFAKPELSQLQTDLRQRNGAMDTPSAYRSEQERSGCRNWRIR